MTRLLVVLVFAAQIANATSIVILRSPRGTKIVVAADSQVSLDAATPVNSCKILQIEKNYWMANSGLLFEPLTKFDPYQIAVQAAAQHKNSLDEIVSVVREKTMAVLPTALKNRRKALGEAAFWREYKSGLDAQEEAFWGVENGALRLVYIQFGIRKGWLGSLKISPSVHACPGDACPNPAGGFAINLGHHKVSDGYRAKNVDWPSQAPLETLAKQFVQMEIDEEADCECSDPVVVLRMDKSGVARWIGDMGPQCRPAQ
ncbi:MAG TPA: hypothetical protein VND65_05525 [Candidatus Binatia bacterium]|nr:hypothetical protein [Candidatus Binatia bacterium]